MTEKRQVIMKSINAGFNFAICMNSVETAKECNMNYSLLLHTWQIKTIRRKMVDIITKEVTSNDMKEVVNKL